MRKIEIEHWALDVIDRVASGQPVEDSRVELKREWPDPIGAARRIAGHANAARGEPILWIIGVDEQKREAKGVEALEFSNWWAQVSSRFDSVFPQLVDVILARDGVSICALFMETDRAPFVINNPTGGQFSREVPWREGTSTTSAKREHLIRLLSPLMSRPSADILKCTLIQSFPQRTVGGKTDEHIRLGLKFFLHQKQGQQSVFTSHQTRAVVQLGDIERSLSHVDFRRKSHCELVGPGYGFCSATEDTVVHSRSPSISQVATVSILFGLPNCDIPLRISAQLTQTEQKPLSTTWEIRHSAEPAESDSGPPIMVISR